MKKVFLVFMMFVSMSSVMAKDTVVRKYKYYRLDKVLESYVSESDEEFIELDKDDYVLSNLSELSTDKPEEKDYRNIYSYDGYEYNKKLKANKFTIFSNSTSTISNFMVFYEGTQINYSCDYVSNTLLHFDENDTITCSLDEEYDMSKITISFKTSNDNVYQFLVKVYHDDVRLSEMIMYCEKNVNVYLYGREFPYNTSAYFKVYSKDKLDDEYLSDEKEVTLYQYEDYLYQSYRLNKDYYPEYLEDAYLDYLYKDTSDYIDVTITTPDEIILDSNDNFSNKTLEESLDVSNDISETIEPTITKVAEVTSPSNTVNVFDISTTRTPEYSYVEKVDTSNEKIKSKNNHFIFYLFLLIIILIINKIRKKLKNRS